MVVLDACTTSARAGAAPASKATARRATESLVLMAGPWGYGSIASEGRCRPIREGDSRFDQKTWHSGPRHFLSRVTAVGCKEPVAYTACVGYEKRHAGPGNARRRGVAGL